MALKRATSTIPIVFSPLTDPVASGLVTNLAHPGGNITGLSNMFGDLAKKQVELLTMLIPQVSRIGALANPENPATRGALRNMAVATGQAGIMLVHVEARDTAEIEAGMTTAARKGAQAVVVVGDTLFLQHRAQIAKIAIKNRIVLMSSFPEEAAAGALISYGTDLVDGYRRTAVYVDKILKGANPGDLPIQQPTTIHLVINRKTASALGFVIPNELLIRADEVIE